MAKKHLHAKRRKFVNVFGSKLQFFIRLVSWTLLIILITTFLSLHLEFWLLDIYVSYIPQIFITSITLYILIAALYGRFIVRDGWDVCWRFIGWKEGSMFVLSGILTLYIVIFSSNIFNPVPPNSINHNLVVGTYNMLYANPEIYQAAYYFSGENADIIALQEVTPEFAKEAMEILNFDYIEITDCGCSAKETELAIISKYPLANSSQIVSNKNGAILRAEAKIDGDTTVAVYAVHIPPPLKDSFYQLRNSSLNLLSLSISTERLKPIVMGDFNTAVYAPPMQDFIDQTDDRIDNIAESSWPKCSWFGFGPVTCARIDQIFVSKQFGMGKREIGPGFGSDHRPLTVELLVN